MCGPWTIKICDDSAGSIGNVDYAAIVLSTNTVSYTSTPPSALAIPPTGTGGACTGTGASANTLTWSMTVPGGGTIADVDAIVNLSHARYGDVVMTLSHAGVTAVLLDGLVVSVTGINSDLCGSYTLDDEAPTAIDAAAIAAGGGTNCIPTGASNPYSPDGLLSVFDGIDRGGVWTLTVCDDQSLNSGTFFGLTLKFSPNCAYALSVFQPAGNPASSLTFKMTCGYPFHTYVNAISLTPGSTPNGWFYGLDIPVADLIAEISFGPPFIGSLDSCGNATVVVPGPIIPGLQLTLVGLAFSPTTSALSAHTNAFFYTTL
jgi:subtilisin-like proprotein convertase family protein